MAEPEVKPAWVEVAHQTPYFALTLRDNTERPETITIGTNELIGTDPGKLPPALARLMAGQWKKGAIPPRWDGKAAERIVEHLERMLTSTWATSRQDRKIAA